MVEIMGHNDPRVRSIKRRLASIELQRSGRSAQYWNRSAIQTALDNHLTGDFSDITKLARTLMRDSAYASALNKRVEGLLLSDFHVVPAEENVLEEWIAKDIESTWWDQWPELTIRSFLISYHNVGVGLAFIEWMRDGVNWRPCITLCDTEDLRWDQGTQQWVYMTTQGERVVTPGDGNWIMMSQWRHGEPSGFVQSLANDWLAKQLGWTDWQDGNQTHVDPIIVVSEPADVTAASGMSDEETIDALAAEIQTRKRDRVLYLQGGKTASTLDMGSGYRPESFRQVIEHVDRAYHIRILGANLSTEINSSGGNRAASETHYGVERERARWDAQILSTTLRNQYMKDYVDINYGVDIVRTPWPMWDTQPASDLAELASTLKTVSEMIPRNKAYIANLPELGDKFGIDIALYADEAAPSPSAGEEEE